MSTQRQIKFRAWDGSKMIMPETTEGSGSSAEIYVMDFFGRASLINMYGLGMKPVDVLSDLIIMEWSSLQDQNEVDIYEGDIMDYGNGNIKEVVFLNGSFGVLTNSEEGSSFGSYLIHHGTVIGNKYQHPELLKK